MKRSLYLLLLICIPSALAGLGLAWVRASYRERDSVEKAKLAAYVRAKKPAEYFAGLVREADEVVISYYPGQGGVDIRLSDHVWLSHLAEILGNASYERMSHGLWISEPEIRIYCRHKEILNLMTLDSILRGLGERESGDFIVGEETTNAIHALIQQTQPNQLTLLTPASGTPAAEAPVAPPPGVADR